MNDNGVAISPLSRATARVHREHSIEPVMNASDEREPFCFLERVAGSVAMAAVALAAVLAFQGILQPLNQNQSANASNATRQPSAKVSRRQNHARTRTARASDESPTSDGAAVRPPSPGAEQPKEAPAMSDAPAPVIGPVDLFRMRDDVVAQSPKPEREVSMLAPREAEKNPSSRADSLWIQAKLHELGYYSGNITGIWGPVSRSALRDFKTMNGLPGDDRWDRDTEQALSSRQGVRASGTFIGGWARSFEACRTGRGAPIVIRSTGASTDAGKCDFRSVRQETATTWRIQAACFAGERTWQANVSLKLTASSLNWTSERGTNTYVRCPKSDIAAAGFSGNVAGPTLLDYLRRQATR
jgi:hypothetical protein